MMNKGALVSKLMEVTSRSEEECILINDVLENHFIVGHNNKDKIKADFMEKLNIIDEEADKLYNTCAEIIVKGIIKRK